MPHHADQDFLSLLQAQAARQARLEEHRVLPPGLDVLTSFIGRYPWQIIFVLSGLSAVVVRLLGGGGTGLGGLQ